VSVRSIVSGVVAQFQEELTELVETSLAEGMEPRGFGERVAGLKAVLAKAGRRAFTEIVRTAEEHEDIVEHDGRWHRFKQPSRKEWLTPFGLVQIERRYFQPDEGGCGHAPLDHRCGMSGRFMTPDVEEAVALASADLSPAATRDLLARVLVHAPSEKAIRNVITEVGGWAEDAREQIEDRIEDEIAVPDGNMLVVSIDGVNVPLREEGAKTGRPAERPGVRSSNCTKTVWREAGVATISIYRATPGQKPDRQSTKYFARMPETGMTTLFDQHGSAIWDLRRDREFDEIVVICDGKPALWNAIDEDPFYVNATQVLDFFHAAEHLSKAAEAIFGKKKRRATAWYGKCKALLLEDIAGLERLLGSLRYYRKSLRAGSERRAVVDRVIGYYTRNRERMRYAAFRARGLSIGSGVVEAACKSIVGARLKRSGMRWTHEGGQQVLNLRTRARSGEWPSFWATYLDARTAA
jgi:hypothetical protein